MSSASHWLTEWHSLEEVYARLQAQPSTPTVAYSPQEPSLADYPS
jgi:hypothetical protein